MQHTPGPWSLSNVGWLKAGYISVDAPSHGGLAQVVWKMEDDERSPECEANAHLIAAAPDLLAALKTARRFVASSHEPSSVELNEIDAAIAKAQGE